MIAVSRSPVHEFHKVPASRIRLITGLGIEGDAHAGVTVQHRSRVARDPSRPNLRQIHLLHAELHDELRSGGFEVGPGILGENVLTRGLALLRLPRDTQLHIGPTAVVRVTGLRNPCRQLDDYQPGLMAAVLTRDEHGDIVRKAGVMGIVLVGGEVQAGDAIRAELPLPPYSALTTV
ncbi:MAG: MOSC domain-containing protein [Hyphomicrobiales bacterium]|nr:MOSC domain-containing protein [Hyphomicrobiales bacterium]